jgi:hypothetical protein
MGVVAAGFQGVVKMRGLPFSVTEQVLPNLNHDLDRLLPVHPGNFWYTIRNVELLNVSRKRKRCFHLESVNHVSVVSALGKRCFENLSLELDRDASLPSVKTTF